MPICSAKFLNMMALAEFINIDTQTDGVLLITSAGRFIGTLLTFPKFKDSSCNSLAKIIKDSTENMIESNKLANKDCEIISDDFFITLKDAHFINDKNKIILSINQINIYCSEIIAFSPVNINKSLQQVY